MNTMGILSRIGIYNPELEKLIENAINAELPPAPVVANPIQAEEDEWLDPLRLGGTMILRDSL